MVGTMGKALRMPAGWLTLALLAVAVAAVTTAWGPAAPSGGKVLSVTEMSAVFGDNPAAALTPCKKAYTCGSQFTDGASNCALCIDRVTGMPSPSPRNMCCNLGTNSWCQPNSTASAKT